MSGREKPVALTVDQLVLGRKDQDNPADELRGVGILFTPPLDEDFWLFQIGLSENQALNAFPKFGTIGIGFAVEEDWNTNLPYKASAQVILDHIRHNLGPDEISDEVLLAAIEMLREAARQHQGLSDEKWASEQARVAAGI